MKKREKNGVIIGKVSLK